MSQCVPSVTELKKFVCLFVCLFGGGLFVLFCLFVFSSKEYQLQHSRANYAYKLSLEA